MVRKRKKKEKKEREGKREKWRNRQMYEEGKGIEQKTERRKEKKKFSQE